MIFYLVITACQFSPPGTSYVLPPDPAQSAGYNQVTFQSTFDPSLVDTAGIHQSGMQWYFTNYFHFAPSSPNSVDFIHGGGIIVGANNLPSDISTFVMQGTDWRGEAFGGGMYVEAAISFSPAMVISQGGEDWPAFWHEALEHVTGQDQWAAQAPQFSHFIEVDTMEFLPILEATTYAATAHDWWGEYGSTCQPGYCGYASPGNIIGPFTGRDFTAFHLYGMLWVPATSTTTGSISWYFDRKPVNRVTYNKYVAGLDSPPVSSLKPWAFGVVDGQHLNLQLSTSENEPMTVLSVTVWQSSTTENLFQ